MAAKNQTSTITLGLRDLFSGGLAKAGAAASGFTKHLDGLNARMAAFSGRINSAGASFTQNFSLPAGLAFAAATKGAADAETAFIDVERAFGDGNVTLQEMQKNAAKLGLSVTDLGNRMADVGFAGITDPTEALKFVELSRKSAVAFNVPLEQITSNMMAVRSGYGLTFGGVQQALEGMNIAADASSAKVSDIADATQRLASYGRLLNIPAATMSAYAAAGISAGLSSERLSTGLNSVFRSMTAGEGATDRVKSGFRAIGLEAEDVQRKMNIDPEGTLKEVLERLNGIDDASKRISTINDIVGADNGDEVAVLVGQLKEVSRIQSEISGKATGSIDKEYEKRAGSLSNSLQRLGSAFSNLGIAVGSVFAPEIKSAADALERFNVFAASNPAIVAGIAKSLVAVAAAGPGMLVLGKVASTFSWFGTAAAFALRPVGLLGQTLTATSVAVGRFGTKSGKAAAVTARTLAMSLAHLGVVGAVAAGAGLLIWKSWEPLKRAFSDFWNSPNMSSAWTNGFEAIDALLAGDWTGFRTHALTAMNALGRAVAALGRDIGGSLGKAWASIVAELDQRVPAFKGFRESVSDLVDSIGALGSEIFKNFSSEDADRAGGALKRFAEAAGSAALDSAATLLRGAADGLDVLTAAIKRYRGEEMPPLPGLQGANDNNGGLKAAFDGLPPLGKLAAVGAGFKLVGAGARIFATAISALRIPTLMGTVGSLRGLGMLKFGAIAFGLAEVAKSMGLLDENADTVQIAAYAAAIPALLDAGAAAYSGAKWLGAGVRAAAKYVAGFRVAQGIGSAISAAWNALKTVAARAAGALAGAAYAAGAAIAGAIARLVALAWSGLKTFAAFAAGAVQGRAFAAGMALSSAVGGALSGAFGAAAGGATLAAAGAAGTVLGIAMGAAMAAAVAAALLGVLQKVDPKGNLGGLTKPIDDGLRKLFNLKEQDYGITPGEIWDGAVNGGNMPKPPPIPGLQATNDNLARAEKAMAVATPIVKLVSEQIPGAGSELSSKFPGKGGKDDLDIGLLRAGVDRQASATDGLKAQISTDLAGVKGAVDQNSRAVVAAISTIAPGISAAISAGLSWQRNSTPSSTAPGAAPAAFVSSSGRSGPQ